MNNKHYIGDRISEFDRYNDIGPITGVLLKGKDIEFFVGEKDGYVMEIDCPYGTRAMAENLLLGFGDYIYRGYRAVASDIPPEAELGDAVTVHGIYSVIAYRAVTFGPGHMSEISAPGSEEHEYEYVSQYKRKMDQMQDQIDDLRDEINKLKDSLPGPGDGGTVEPCQHPRTVNMDFSEWRKSKFTETLDEGTVVEYVVEFDGAGRPGKIITVGDDHEVTINW